MLNGKQMKQDERKGINSEKKRKPNKKEVKMCTTEKLQTGNGKGVMQNA